MKVVVFIELLPDGHIGTQAHPPADSFLSSLMCISCIPVKVSILKNNLR